MLQRIHTGDAFQDDNAVSVVRHWNVKLTHGMDLGRHDDESRHFWRALIATLVLAPGTADCRSSGQDYGTPPFKRDLHANLPAGSSAVFILVPLSTLLGIVPELHRCGGTLLQTRIEVA